MRKLLSALAVATIPLPGLAAGFTVESADIPAKSKISEKFVLNTFGCTGKNLSPAISWKNLPAGTASLVLTVYDPDAPTGSGWWHWVVYDIPAQSSGLPAGAGNTDQVQLAAGGTQGRTDFGKPGWGGPCPPKGDKPHRYTFTLHALKVPKLDVPADASPALIGYMVHLNEIAKTRFVANYSR